MDPDNQPQVLNEDLVAAYNEAPEGQLKNASALSNKIIRRKIRENGFQRRILPFEDVKQTDLTPSLTSELPHIVEEMEAEQPGAASVNYNDTPDTVFFRGDKFAVFGRLGRKNYVENANHLEDKDLNNGAFLCPRNLSAA